MRYQVKSFRLLLVENLTDSINNELEKLGLDACDVINVAHHHNVAIVYYRQEKADD